ncbi:MAG: nucleoside-diphosphate kinase [Elusimicrobia bacterium]|nr:nucleoside-diphosphate kinase [Elusimicrobiota bacterium]
MEKTLVIIKPDGMCKKLVGKVLSRFEEAGFKIVGLKMLKLTEKIYDEFYASHKGKFFYEPYKEFMLSAPIIPCVLGGKNVITAVRKIIGNTDSKKAEQGTIRNLYGLNDRRNIVHASDSPETAELEINYFFDKTEIYTYNDDDWMEKKKAADEHR